MFLSAESLLHSCSLIKESFEESRFEHLSRNMSGNDNSSVQSTSNFSFFNGKEPPKLPSTPGSTFSCFSFGQPSQASIKNSFSFGSNHPSKPINFDDKIISIQQSLTAISSQPRPSFDPATQKTISERAQRIAVLECAFGEVKSLKSKVLSLETCIGKLLTDELDTMKEDVNSTVGFPKSFKDKLSLTPPTGSNLFKSTSQIPFSFGDNGVVTTTASGIFGAVKPKTLFELVTPVSASAIGSTAVGSSSSAVDNTAKRDLDSSGESSEEREQAVLPTENTDTDEN